MKIVSVSRIYPTHRPGGMGFVAQDRAHALAKAGHEVHILTTGAHRGEADVMDAFVHVHHLDCKPLAYSDEFASRCREACESIRPDIIHLDSFDTDRLWWAGRPRGVKKVAITLHGFCWGSALTKWNLYKLGQGPAPQFDFVGMVHERESLMQADAVIGISRHEHWMLKDLLGIPHARLVYNPIAPGFFAKPIVDPPKSPRLLCAAISGHGERLFAVAKKAASKAGIPLDVVSKSPRQLMPGVYDEHSALIVPTAYSQGLDLTVAEAVARGRPVIASATGSYLRESEVSSSVSVAPLGDIDSLARAMSLLTQCNHRESDKHRPEVHVSNWMSAINV
jgi:glycosyltransferase involved in cell wall biosynthesis